MDLSSFPLSLTLKNSLSSCFSLWNSLLCFRLLHKNTRDILRKYFYSSANLAVSHSIESYCNGSPHSTSSEFEIERWKNDFWEVLLCCVETVYISILGKNPSSSNQQILAQAHFEGKLLEMFCLVLFWIRSNLMWFCRNFGRLNDDLKKCFYEKKLMNWWRWLRKTIKMIKNWG